MISLEYRERDIDAMVNLHTIVDMYFILLEKMEIFVKRNTSSIKCLELLRILFRIREIKKKTD